MIDTTSKKKQIPMLVEEMIDTRPKALKPHKDSLEETKEVDES